MISAMASIVVNFLEKRNVIDPKARETYVYGCDIALYTMLSTVGLLIIGCLFGRLWETELLISIFYLNQSVGGGFHATTHMRCFVTMTGGVLVYMALYTLPLSVEITSCLGFASCILLYCFPLILHKNKKHLIGKSDALIRRSRLIIVLQAAALLLCSLMAPASGFTKTLAFGLLLSSISRCVAVIRRRATSHA